MNQDLRQDRDSVDHPLAGAVILVLEDQYEVARLLDVAIEDAGGQVAANIGTIDEALTVIREEILAAAVITMIAGGIHTDLVARELKRREIPFVVTTGIGTDASHPALHAAKVVFKPFQPSFIVAVLAELLAIGSRP